MRRTTLDPSSSPAAAFGTQLRRSREAKGLSQVDFGELIRFSDSFVSCVERATRNPTHAFATRADDVLETGGTLELMWWQMHHTALIEGFPAFAAEEAKARSMRLFELDVIPGLLQTVEYAAAYEAAPVKRGEVSQQQADERVSFLLARQERIERTPPPLVQAVVDEWAIRRPIGGQDTMVGQLKHLERLSERPNVILQVAPISLGESRPFTHAITLLTLSNRTILGYTETLHRGFLERDADTVSDWSRNYDRLQVEALSQAASVDLIHAVRKEFEDHAH
ncbi:helix-turn-helix transcriptional regulator [Kitasatospora cystarginea]|uniref:Helix-turn-helix transcriptional regulator n=1 Tax=Kitasatospora cystarginea TaxID=58350 RepID=A0ABN3DVW6_9ACTN